MLDRGNESRDSKSFWWLFSFLKPHIGKLILLILFLAASSLTNLAPPFLMKIAIDDYIIKGDINGIVFICISILVFGLVEGIVGFGNRYLENLLGNKLVMDIRMTLFKHINRLSFAYFDKQRIGDLMSRMISDTRHVKFFLSNALINLFTNLVRLIGILIILFTWSAGFGFIFLALLGPILIGMYYFNKRVAPVFRQSRRANGILNAKLQESLNGIREVKLYGRENYILKIFSKWNNEYYKSLINANKLTSFWGPYVPFLISIASALVFLFGGILVSLDNLSIGSLLASIAYFAMLGGPIRSLTRFFERYNHTKASGDRIVEIFNKYPDVREAEDAKPIEGFIKGRIEFMNVKFGYHPGNDIINDITLDIQPGELIAFVGPSGVGKTTLLHLVPRFYDIQEGSIKIDGEDIRAFKLDSLRKHIGIVMQDTFLFDGTIKDNITYGNIKATKDEIERAAEVAQLTDFINLLPKRYNTQIGERGVRLSGGQAQRLAIARALVTNPSILILDEPTANVDAITDEKLINAVRVLMKGRTTLVIAHRLWTIKNADRIVLLRDGKIEAIGNHQQLLDQNEFYKEFFASQFIKSDDIENRGVS